MARVALEFLETAPAIHRADAWRLGREIFSHDSTCESGRSAKLRGRSLWPLVVVALLEASLMARNRRSERRCRGEALDMKPFKRPRRLSQSNA